MKILIKKNTANSTASSRIVTARNDSESNWLDENLNCQDYFRKTRRHARPTCTDAPTAARPVNLQLTGTLDIRTALELWATSGFFREVDETWTYCPPSTLNIHTTGCRTNVQILSKIRSTDTRADNKHKQLYNKQNAIVKYWKHSYMFRLFVCSHLQGTVVFKDVYIFVIQLCQL